MLCGVIRAVWPHPTRARLTIQPPTGATYLHLFDATGRLVLALPTPTGQAVCLRLPGGLYVVKAGAQTTRVVVE